MCSDGTQINNNSATIDAEQCKNEDPTCMERQMQTSGEHANKYAYGVRQMMRQIITMKNPHTFIHSFASIYFIFAYSWSLCRSAWRARCHCRLYSIRLRQEVDFIPFFFFFFFLLQMLTNHILMCSRFTRPHTFGWHQQVRARGHAQWSAVCRQRPLTTDIHISNITAGVKIKCHISHYTQIRRRKQTFGKDHLTEQKTKNVCMWRGVDANNTRTNRRRCCCCRMLRRNEFLIEHNWWVSFPFYTPKRFGTALHDFKSKS